MTLLLSSGEERSLLRIRPVFAGVCRHAAFPAFTAVCLMWGTFVFVVAYADSVGEGVSAKISGGRDQDRETDRLEVESPVCRSITW